VIGVLVLWLSEVWYGNGDKPCRLEAEPSSFHGTFLGYRILRSQRFMDSGQKKYERFSEMMQ
jgi:hypothetical protein